MIKIHLSGTEKDLKGFKPSIEEISTILNISALEKNSKNKFFHQYLDVIPKKNIYIPNAERSNYEG